MRSMLRAAVVLAALGCALSADAQILERFGIGRDNEPESVLQRVRAGEFNERCAATVAGAAEEEHREEAARAAQQQGNLSAPSPDVYNLFDALLNAPTAAAQGVRTIPATRMAPVFQRITERVMRVQPPPPGVNVSISVEIQNSQDIDSRQVIDARQERAGEILLSRGLLEALRERPNIPETQVGNEYAFIIAHEYAHILLCHYNRGLAQERSRQTFRNVSTIGLLVALAANSTMTRTASGVVVDTDDDAGKDMIKLLAATTLLSEFNSAVINPAWGRGQERDADRLAYELVREAGLDPSFAPGVITELFNADRRANERFRQIAEQVPRQALSALLLSLNDANTSESLESRLQAIALTTGIQMFQQWRMNQRRHFHDDPERRSARIAAMDQLYARLSGVEGGVVAEAFDAEEGRVFAATQGAAIREGYADLLAPDLARQASEAMMVGDYDTGCARAAEALHAGPALIQALMVSGQCALHRDNRVEATRHFDLALQSERATPGDFMTVAGIWSQLRERPPSEAALLAGGRRFHPDMFYVERINVAGEFDDLTAVQAVTTECQGSQIPDIRDNCTRRQIELINSAAQAAQAGVQPRQGNNPFSSLVRSGQNALGRITGGGAQDQSTAPSPEPPQGESQQAGDR